MSLLRLGARAAATFALVVCGAVGISCVPSFVDTLAGLQDGSTRVSVDFEMHLERFDTKSGRFETLPAPPTKRNLFTVENAGGKVVVIGGLDKNGAYVADVDVYDPARRLWSKGAPWKRVHTAYSAKVGNTICLFGGAAGRDAHLSRDVDCYDASTDTWSERADVPADVGGGLFPAVYVGKIYLLGSTKFDAKELVTPLAVAYSYDPKTDTWAALRLPPSSRGGAGVVAFEDKLYVLAGFSKPSEETAAPESEMLIYDPKSDTWSAGKQMPGRGIGFGVDVLTSGPSAYLGLGSVTLHHYDAKKGAWVAGKEPERDLDAGIYSSVVQGGNLYLLVIVDKAHSSGTESSGKLWKYDAEKDTWSVVGTRSPDNRDALFYGSAMGDDLFFVGAFTTVHLTQVDPARDGGAVPSNDAALVADGK